MAHHHDCLPAQDIAEHTETKPFGLDPLHEVTDRAKVAILVKDMAVHGWTGPPIVADGEQAYTGVHRIAAVTLLANSDGIEVQIPRVQISDLCALYDVDWAALTDDCNGDRYEAATSLHSLLPVAVLEYLGYDVDGT